MASTVWLILRSLRGSGFASKNATISAAAASDE